jgi:hypothetical protein
VKLVQKHCYTEETVHGGGGPLSRYRGRFDVYYLSFIMRFNSCMTFNLRAIESEGQLLEDQGQHSTNGTSLGSTVSSASGLLLELGWQY